MAHGGKRPGAGRRPRAKDRAAAAEVASLSALARQHTPLALKTLAKVAAKGMSEAAQVSAATAILDRGYGRPMQSMEHSGPGGGAIKHDLSVYSDEHLAQLSAILGTATNARRGAGGDTPEGGEAKR